MILRCNRGKHGTSLIWSLAVGFALGITTSGCISATEQVQQSTPPTATQAAPASPSAVPPVTPSAATQIAQVAPPTAPPPPPVDSAALQAVVDSARAGYTGDLGFLVKHLGTGATASVNSDRLFRSASLYKLFLLYAAFAQAERGEISLGETLTLSKQAFASDPYAEWPAGTRLSVTCAMSGMIVRSSNSAAHMLLERVGGWGQVRQEIAPLGIARTGPGSDGSTYTTASEVALLLEAIAGGRAVSPRASEEMLTLLKGQYYNDRLPLPLPVGIEVAHKTGELTRLRNDAGIVFAPSGPYLFVALASRAPTDAAARQVIVGLSDQVYGLFQPGELRTYQGLPPRLAAEMLRTPNAQGPILPLPDDWAQTVSVARDQADLASGVNEVRLREMVVPDLLAMQQSAKAAGAPFWIARGYPGMSDPEAPFFLDSAVLGCPVELPAGRAPLGRPPAEFAASAAPPAVSQEWLGTAVRITDDPAVKLPQSDFAISAPGRWLLASAWEYGFILLPAEGAEGAVGRYQPWSLRWVGREMARRLHDLGYEGRPAEVAIGELGQAQRTEAGR